MIIIAAIFWVPVLALCELVVIVHVAAPRCIYFIIMMVKQFPREKSSTMAWIQIITLIIEILVIILHLILETILLIKLKYKLYPSYVIFTLLLYIGYLILIALLNHWAYAVFKEYQKYGNVFAKN